MSTDAWHFSEGSESDISIDRELRTTNSARRVKALVEQITGKQLPRVIYSHLLIHSIPSEQTGTKHFRALPKKRRFSPKYKCVYWNYIIRGYPRLLMDSNRYLHFLLGVSLGHLVCFLVMEKTHWPEWKVLNAY